MSEPQPTDRVRLTHTGPLDATRLLELYVPGSPAVTIEHDGDVTPAAMKWAKRLEIELVRVQTAPQADAVRSAPVAPTAPEAPIAPMVPAVLSAPDVPTVPTVPAVPTVPKQGSELPEPPAEPGILPDPAPAPSLLVPAIAVPQPEPQPEPQSQLIVAASEPAPELAHGPVTEPALPWDASMPSPEPAAVHVEIGEMLSFPWNTLDAIAQRASDEDDHHEVMPGSARRVPTLDHPTSLLPKGPNWGLPWPRPVALAGAVAKADPALWHEPERLAAMRADLEKVGAPSFGAAKPEASAWLKKLSDSG